MAIADTKQRILLAAGPIFSKKGYRAATVREICEAAEVNVASVNYYFGDKQKLYIETVILARQMRVQEAPFPEWDAETSPAKRLEDFIRIILKRLVAMETVPWQVHLLVREIINPTEACSALVEEYFRPFFEVLLGIVDDVAGIQFSKFQRQQIGFSIIGQCVHYRFSNGVMSLLLTDEEYDHHFDLDQLTSHITAFSLGAIERLKVKNTQVSSETLSQS